MKKFAFTTLIAAALLSACKNDSKPVEMMFRSPEAGTNFLSKEKTTVELNFGGEKIDSVVYLIDSTILASKRDTTGISVGFDTLSMGNHLITAKVYHNKTVSEVTSNIIIVPEAEPVKYSYKVVHTYPHDPLSYVEGLEYHNGLLYESDGGDADLGGGSSLRVVVPETGKIVKQVPLPGYFAEGITIIGDKIIQLTYKEGVGYVFDKHTLEKTGEFPYRGSPEGWGLAYDGNKILNTDGSNSIFFLNTTNYQRAGSVEVYDNKGPVESLNELEVINGKIYANVYQKPVILIINPKTGVVEGEADLSALLPKGSDANYVLNGIAWDAGGRRLFVTGKFWDKLYEIKLEVEGVR